jgi:uncharacterized membrane protein YfcA
MPIETLALLTVGVLVVAFLYSSVGHAGASGYIAVMALASLAPATIKPTALALNIVVATIGSWQFWRAGHFRWALFWPFALASIPLAFVGGRLDLPADWFRLLVGLVLLFSAAYFFWHPTVDEARGRPPLPVALGAGGGLGLMAGLTGTGGGIFLTPLLLLTKWAKTKEASATSALFILCNSIAGLAGNASATKQLPAFLAPLAIAVVVGGAAGSWLGARRFPVPTIKRLLAAVLAIAGAKLVHEGVKALWGG